MSNREKDLKENLNPEQYHVLRQSGTEKPFSGIYNNHNEAGTYVCVGCDNVLFSSENKFHSGCGWPSFDDIENLDSVYTQIDDSHEMQRVEVLCKKCDGHLGHVFPDGPKETTGLRYCINSVVLNFRPKNK